MIAEVVAVGRELLRHGAPDTNSAWLVERLHEAGIEVAARAAIDDDPERLASFLSGALARADLVLLTGGLGPTADDRTRPALASALGVALESDPARVALLRELYARHCQPFGDGEARQATRPAGADWIENPLGSAPGLLVRRPGRLLAALPGVPWEMRAMFEAGVLPLLRRLAPGTIGQRTLRIAGLGEAELERILGDLIEPLGIELTVLGGIEGLELHACASGAERRAVAARLEEFERAARQRLGANLVGGRDDRLPAVVGALLAERRQTVATAESCTAGLLAAALTSAPGSTAWFRGGLIVYDDRLKIELAGVNPRSIQAHGAVSPEVARELACGARSRCGADIGVGVTGIAGPGGGSADEPVGLVELAIAAPRGWLSWNLRLLGDRAAVRGRAVTEALDRLRRLLLEPT